MFTPLRAALITAICVLSACAPPNPATLEVRTASEAYFSKDHTYGVMVLSDRSVNLGLLVFCEPRAGSVTIRYGRQSAYPECRENKTVIYGNIDGGVTIGADAIFRQQRLTLSDGTLITVGRIGQDEAILRGEPDTTPRVLTARTEAAGKASVFGTISQQHTFTKGAVHLLGQVNLGGVFSPSKRHAELLALIESEVTGPAGMPLIKAPQLIVHMNCSGSVGLRACLVDPL